MRIVTKIAFVLLVAYLGFGCASVHTGKTAGKTDSYTEDLSAYLPAPEPPATEEVEPAEPDTPEAVIDSSAVEVTTMLNTVLDTAAIYSRKTIRYIDGFTIQVYGGADRAMAKEYRMKVLRHFPEAEPVTVFEQPNYKVRIGTYYTRLEAQPLFTEIKEVFPRAILIPKRIYIKQ